MIVRQLAPQAGRRALFNHVSGSRLGRRALATEIEQNEALLSRQLNEAALATGLAVPDTDVPSPKPRRRRRALDPAVQTYLSRKHMDQTTGKYGSNHSGYYQPNAVIHHPPRPSQVTLELLLASQAHLGHSTSLWNPANSRYIFGIREGIHIISLDVTAAHLRRAARVVAGVSERGGIILFVGTRPGFDRCVVRAAELSGQCHLFERWTPGSITNGQQILGRCRTKVVDEYDNEVPGFREQLLERSALKPDLVVVLNPLENRVLLQECAQCHIPTIGIIDTDANPTWVTYPIPANDDSLRCVQVIAGVLGRAGEEGLHRRREAATRGVRTYLPTEGLELPADFEEQQDMAEAERPGITDLARQAGTPSTITALSLPDSASNPDSSTTLLAEQGLSGVDDRLTTIMSQLNQTELRAISEGTMTREQIDAIAADGRLTPENAKILADSISESETNAQSTLLDEGEYTTDQRRLMEIIFKLTDSERQALQANALTSEVLARAVIDGRLIEEEARILANAIDDDSAGEEASVGDIAEDEGTDPSYSLEDAAESNTGIDNNSSDQDTSTLRMGDTYNMNAFEDETVQPTPQQEQGVERMGQNPPELDLDIEKDPAHYSRKADQEDLTGTSSQVRGSK